MMKDKIMSAIVMAALCMTAVVVILIGVYLVPLSHQTAAENPTLVHMRVPVLMMGWLILACVLTLLAVAFAFLLRISQNKIFEQKSVSLLKSMAMISLAPIPVLIALFFYTQANVTGSITNFWVLVGILGLAIVSIFFFLVASLFQKAVDYKTDVELTI